MVFRIIGSSDSPLEVATAFDAPLLRDVACNINGRRVARREGDREVRHGLVDEKGKIGERCGLLGVDTLTVADTAWREAIVGRVFRVVEGCVRSQVWFDAEAASGEAGAGEVELLAVGLSR